MNYTNPSEYIIQPYNQWNCFLLLLYRISPKLFLYYRLKLSASIYLFCTPMRIIDLIIFKYNFHWSQSFCVITFQLFDWVCNNLICTVVVIVITELVLVFILIADEVVIVGDFKDFTDVEGSWKLETSQKLLFPTQKRYHIYYKEWKLFSFLHSSGLLKSSFKRGVLEAVKSLFSPFTSSLIGSWLYLVSLILAVWG